MHGVIASFYREYKVRVSSPRIFVENIANPLFILFIFGLSLSNTVGNIVISGKQTVSYLDFFVIGAINISLITNAMVASTKMFLDKYMGLYEEMLSYPINRIDILLGKFIFNLLLSLTQATIMLFFVKIISRSVNINIIDVFKILCVIALGSSTFFFIMIILALKLKTQDSFNTAYYLIMTPVIFISSTYYPVNNMPMILKVLAQINPLSWLADICRQLYLGIPTTYFELKLIMLIIVSIISFLISARSFSKGID